MYAAGYVLLCMLLVMYCYVCYWLCIRSYLKSVLRYFFTFESGHSILHEQGREDPWVGVFLAAKRDRRE